MRYRIISGELGNERGHIRVCRAQSDKGALRAARREARLYGYCNGEIGGWAYVEYLHTTAADSIYNMDMWDRV